MCQEAHVLRIFLLSFVFASLISLLSPQLGQTDECELTEPIALPSQLVKGSTILLKNAKFFPAFTTGGLVQDYAQRPMVLELFLISVGQKPTPWAGALFRLADRNPWWSYIGFSKHYGLNMKVNGQIQTDEDETFYQTQVIHGQMAGNPEPLTTALTMKIKGNHITHLALTVPMESNCVEKGNEVWCNFTGVNETRCLYSADAESQSPPLRR